MSQLCSEKGVDKRYFSTLSLKFYLQRAEIGALFKAKLSSMKSISLSLKIGNVATATRKYSAPENLAQNVVEVGKVVVVEVLKPLHRRYQQKSLFYLAQRHERRQNH